MKWWGAIAVSMVVTFFGVTAHAAVGTDHVVINEIMANPATGEVEWIELYNPTDVSVSMSGWRLIVTSGNFSGVFADDIVIAPHGYTVRSATDAVSKLNNTSATVTLKPSVSGAAIDTVQYTGIAQAKSYARDCDASDTWVAQAVPTQGTANCAAVVTPPLPKDTILPTINDIPAVDLVGVASLAIAAHDETSVPHIVAAATQYGAEIARCEADGICTLMFDTSLLPNGVVTIDVKATDAAGNSVVQKFDRVIANPGVSRPVVEAPHSEPIKITTPDTSTKPSIPIESVSLPGRGEAIPSQVVSTVSPVRSATFTLASVPVVSAPKAVAVMSKPNSTQSHVSPMVMEPEMARDTHQPLENQVARAPIAAAPIAWHEQWCAIAIVITLAALVMVWRWRRRHKT